MESSERHEAVSTVLILVQVAFCTKTHRLQLHIHLIITKHQVMLFLMMWL
jgi:hypothetical protein